jgi:hypothetical protein
MPRTLIAALFVALGATPAVAQEIPDPRTTIAPALPNRAVDRSAEQARAAVAADDSSQGEAQAPSLRPRFGERAGTTLMVSLYATTATMQALDVHSTLRALDRGALEANPIMGRLVHNRPAFIATKAAVATGTILVARQVAKRNKIAAAVTLIAINSAYAYVAHHNYKVARQLR